MMLAARETRVQRQEQMLQNCSCLVCFTMNIAGPYKISDIIVRAYAEGGAKLLHLFEINNMDVIKTEQYIETTGVEWYIALQQMKRPPISSEVFCYALCFNMQCPARSWHRLHA